jgi:hypothetical protein
LLAREFGAGGFLRLHWTGFTGRTGWATERLLRGDADRTTCSIVRLRYVVVNAAQYEAVTRHRRLALLGVRLVQGDTRPTCLPALMAAMF